MKFLKVVEVVEMVKVVEVVEMVKVPVPVQYHRQHC
jgi:hypothetical protein